MKKFVSMLLAVLMLTALAVPAMADGNSPQVPPETGNSSAGITVKSGDVTVSNGDEDKIEEAFADPDLGLKASDYSKAEAIDISRTDGGSGSITCVITYASTSEHIAKVVYFHDGDWYEAGVTYLGNGQYQLTFSQGLSPVVLLFAPGAATEPGSSGGSSSGGSSSKAPKSPKTGYD